MHAHASVVVIGGGPAGSTAAALLARAGIDVVLLERERFPRYHIGESLLPSCPAVLELTGALKAADAHGFVDKRGALYRWGDEADWVVNWLDLYGNRRSWLVDRGEFDKVLLDNARAQGADVHEEAHVHEVVFDGERPVAVSWSPAGEKDRATTIRFDHLIDASGRAGILSTQHLRNREHHEVFRNVALWAYWRGGRVVDGTPPGGLNSISAPGGWYWLIPLADGRLSAGFVTHRDTFRSRRKEFGSLEEMVRALMAESDNVRPLVEGCEFIGPARVEQDYSYAADRFCGPGWFLSGDAACFLDPLLSTGVHLAMYSATLAAAGIVAVHDGDVTEDEAARFYEYCYRRSYARLLALVAGMYEQYRGKQTYFWSAHRLSHDRTDLTPASVSIRDFADLSAGLTDLAEAEGDHQRRILTAQLLAEARHSQERTVALGTSRIGVPLDFAPSHWAPLNPREVAEDLALVTTPRLGLARITEPEAAAT